MPDEERDYKDWLQSREIDTALASVEAAQDEYDAMVHRLNDALAEHDRLAERVKVLEAALRWYADEIPAEYEIHDSGGYICPASWLSERARAALGGQEDSDGG